MNRNFVIGTGVLCLVVLFATRPGAPVNKDYMSPEDMDSWRRRWTKQKENFEALAAARETSKFREFNRTAGGVMYTPLGSLNFF